MAAMVGTIAKTSTSFFVAGNRARPLQPPWFGHTKKWWPNQAGRLAPQRLVPLGPDLALTFRAQEFEVPYAHSISMTAFVTMVQGSPSSTQLMNDQESFFSFCELAACKFIIDVFLVNILILPNKNWRSQHDLNMRPLV